jgi:predicted ArsR family transcriptional regulator
LENKEVSLSSAGERLLHVLKTRGPQQAADVGALFGMTAEAARQQFTKLAAAGLVEAYSHKRGVGRPSQYWQLTAAGHARFPDTHAELTLQLIDSVRLTFGEQAIERLIDMREQKSRELYLHELKEAATLKERLASLVELRSREGYMAEYEEQEDGNFLFIENHCPICAAAKACQGFCRSELMLFKEVLQADVERIEHVVFEARRCAYRVKPMAS